MQLYWNIILNLPKRVIKIAKRNSFRNQINPYGSQYNCLIKRIKLLCRSSVSHSLV
ncbi:unnamed protein product [Paramecium pentaurelia]|uniref:Uncharacterized protein n=1 Tax=Paramecium pentaurelia TaxID=43138 RepID=A0A8S1XMK0_9CILI|nr:unnamed protein product [Paramecium pentaurelia]